jgi:hypothetical protein
MKIRHFIPWIPFIGIIYIAFFASIFYKSYLKKNKSHDLMEGNIYHWGSRWAYFGSQYFQLVVDLLLLSLIPPHHFHPHGL